MYMTIYHGFLASEDITLLVRYATHVGMLFTEVVPSIFLFPCLLPHVSDTRRRC